MVDVNYGWQGEQKAYVNSIACTCGQDLKEALKASIVETGTKVECKACYREFRFTWKGMYLEQVRSHLW